jgi:hypothetical protein
MIKRIEKTSICTRKQEKQGEKEIRKRSQPRQYYRNNTTRKEL